MHRIAEHSALLWPDGRRLDAAAIRHRVELLAAQLAAEIPEGGHVGLLADNSPDWVLADLALSHHDPYPGFFHRRAMQWTADWRGYDGCHHG
jgi:acyl-CoA synthetase (AMP-forming)/AMP-acid ligase II